MNRELKGLVDRSAGLVTRSAVLAEVPHWVLDHALRAGRLVRLCPQVYATPQLAQDPAVRRRAAISHAGPAAAISHTSALAVWQVGSSAAPSTVHVVVPDSVRIRSGDLVTVHRRRGLRPEPPRVLIRAGVPVTCLEDSLVDSWPLLAPVDRHGPIIDAVGQRRTTPDRLRTVLTSAPKLGARSALTALLDRLAAGCLSPLEIWGHERVFNQRGMPRFARQFPVTIGRQTAYLDVYAEPERVDFELDGAAWHGSADQRERDVRRDAALAAQGILVVRFTHRRLTTEPDDVRREVLAILAARRAGR